MNTSPKKRIIFLTDPREYGGCEILLLDYLATLDYSHIDVILITTKDFFSSRIMARDLPVKVIQFPFKFEGGPFKRFKRFYGLFKQFAPIAQIVYFPGAYYIFKWSEYLAGYVIARGKVYSVENLGLFEPPLKDNSKYFGVIPKLGLWWRKVLFITKLRAKLCRRILTVGEEVKERMITWYGLPARNLYVAHNGVNSHKFYSDEKKKRELREQMGISSNTIVIVSTSRVTHEKCIDRLINAIAKIKNVHKDIYVLIVGDGPLKADLEQLSEDNGTSKLIRFVGYQENVLNYLLVSDIFVLPSDYEGFSIAMLEAMAAGLIPVRTETCGAKEVVQEGENGFLVECSTEGVISGLEKALRLTPEERKIMSRKARDTVKEHFDFQKNIRRAVKLLELEPVQEAER
jgi:glycosyltransferase involved in cell wall biosynthesis